MAASAPLRAVYRRALGVGPDQRLVVFASTWGPDSLFGQHTDLVRGIAAELPMDDYRLVVALHPAVWYWHGPWQVEAWTQDCRRAGITVLPPHDGWRAGLVAADLVVGDHSSVTFYGAALGRPALLATAPAHTVAPDSAVGQFLAAATKLDHTRPVADQFDAAITGHDAAAEPLASILGMTTSAPGEAMSLLRKEFYRLIALAEPPTPADILTVPVPPDDHNTAGAQVVTVELTDDGARITRRPALDDTVPPGAHLSVDLVGSRRRMLDLAEVVVVPDATDATTVLSRLPGCLLATGPTASGTWLVVTTFGDRLEFSGLPGRVIASVVHAWLAAGREVAEFPERMSLRLGRAVHEVTCRVR
jgi:hypothetical protein